MQRGRSDPDPAGTGQESVWDHPRPPRLEPVPERLRVVLGGIIIADAVRGWRVLETSRSPTYCLHPADIVPGALVCGRQRFGLRMEGAGRRLIPSRLGIDTSIPRRPGYQGVRRISADVRSGLASALERIRSTVRRHWT
ncbi:hypothetical protein [Methylobacterium terrae]|uniref:hypothetical protein n=1 Tax=Methylobacterium terrae TaxID=2202827 RepID=UPI001FE08109|nr:hypothetical protein [Methylobacterium terrae]